MKILMAHNYYRIPGGEDLSFRMEAEMLRRNGCEVLTFVEDNAQVDHLGRLRTAARSIWSLDSYRRIRSMLRGSQVDIVHVQNFFPLISPSVYFAARAEGVPVVQSLRNYRLICPGSTLNRNGDICEDCIGRGVPWPAMRHSCYQDSLLGSVAVSGMLAVNRGLGSWSNMVDAYIAMTDFMRDKFVRCGFSADKIFVKPNFLSPDPLPGAGKGDFALYAGRLSEEKGIRTLLRAWDVVGPTAPLKVVGDGPLKSLIEDSKLPLVEYLGWVENHEVLELMGSARFLLLPTEWFEGHPRTVVEAFARGLPIIASRIGAMEETIEDGVSGLLFTPGDTSDLVEKIRWAMDHRDKMSEIGAHGRAIYERLYTPEANYLKLLEVYRYAKAARTASIAGLERPLEGGARGDGRCLPCDNSDVSY
jgi:glycosyltransferase involved in cell wall biosynthesis